VHEACGEPLHAYFICLCPAGHWLGPVTWPGWLGPAQPMWAALGPAPKNYAGPGPAQFKKNKKAEK